ncbi:MAG: hypothetical protein EBY41_01080 [Proteobacteria bacterium]|jgi:hypothetical protein|nr:hypothetical protein [Pseudomonadota bacterium]
MPLPKLKHKLFDLTVPSTKQEIQFRPFLVAEEKVLLLTQEGTPKEVMDSVRQVINNCIVTEGVFVENMTTFDLEYIFIKMRARSINNIVELTYRDLDDDKRYEVTVDLDEIEVKYDDTHTNKIDIDDNLGMIMKYPSADLSTIVEDGVDEVESFMRILRHCIDKIWEGDEVHEVSQYTEEEVVEFIESLDVKTFQKIQTFFDTMPKIRHEVSYTNSLGTEKTIPLTSLADFFTLG